MYDFQTAVAKLRSLELIAEAQAERRAASVRRPRRKRSE
jgi:hypothetical protein